MPRRAVSFLFSATDQLGRWRYRSRRILRWWLTCPAERYASALTVNGFPLATPRRVHASAGRFRKNASVAGADGSKLLHVAP